VNVHPTNGSLAMTELAQQRGRLQPLSEAANTRASDRDAEAVFGLLGSSAANCENRTVFIGARWHRTA
jgi:hypothetical protein